MASNTVNSSLSDQIAKMKEKVRLLEGELRANEDIAQNTITQNRETISQLRQGNTDLRRELTQFRATRHRIVSGNMAVLMLREESISKTKQLNKMVSATQLSRQRLEDLRLRYVALRTGRGAAQEHGRRTREQSGKRRWLVYHLATARQKFQDAANISKGYLQIKEELRLEGFSFQNQLDCLEASVMETREELADLRAAQREAQRSVAAAEAELRRLEDELPLEQEEREELMRLYGLKAGECRALAERAACGAVKTHRRYQVRAAFRHLAAVTGLSNVQEMGEIFVTQGETRERLQGTKAANAEVLRGLNDVASAQDAAKSELQDCVAEKRRKEAEKMAKPQSNLRSGTNRAITDQCNLDSLVATLGNVKPIVERIALKLEDIKLEKEERPDDDDDDDDDDGEDDAEGEEGGDDEDDEDDDDGDEGFNDDEDTEEDDEDEDEEEVKEETKAAPTVEEELEEHTNTISNYWTELNATLKNMVNMLATCATKLLKLNEDNLTAESERRKRRRKAMMAKAKKWKPPKRQKSAARAHARRLRELRKAKAKTMY